MTVPDTYKLCFCADPENCTVVPEGYICKRELMPSDELKRRIENFKQPINPDSLGKYVR